MILVVTGNMNKRTILAGKIAGKVNKRTILAGKVNKRTVVLKDSLVYEEDPAGDFCYNQLKMAEAGSEDERLFVQHEVDDLISQAGRNELDVPTVAMGPLKQVIFRTQVMLGKHGLSTEVANNKVKYRKGDCLHPEDYPALPPGLKNTMAIRMPVLGIDSYYREHLQPWLPLRSDEELVEGLHRYLSHNEHLVEAPAKQSVRMVDLAATPLFATFGIRTQRRLLEKLDALNCRRTYHHGRQVPDLGQLQVLDIIFTPLRKRESKQLQKKLERRKRAIELQFI